jgi:hypothetical protein
MKITEYPQEIRAFAEFACMVCMSEKRKGNSRYMGCSCRPHNEYCPWLNEVIYTAMNATEGEKQDIFTEWVQMPMVKETFKKQAHKVPKQMTIYSNYRGLK